MDWLRLEGLTFYGHHGTEPLEQETGRRFVVDVALGLDLETAGRGDHLADALDYRRVWEAARDVVEGERHQLIERVAWRVMEEMFSRFAPQAVQVRVAKPEAPLGGLNHAATVEFARTHEQWRA